MKKRRIRVDLTYAGCSLAGDPNRVDHTSRREKAGCAASADSILGNILVLYAVSRQLFTPRRRASDAPSQEAFRLAGQAVLPMACDA